MPEPRLGVARPDRVHACLDVSDGLVQDLGHLCRAAGLDAEIKASAVPFSPPARDAGPRWLETCLTGGDDYELLMAVGPDQVSALQQGAAERGVAVSRIGRFVRGPGPGGNVTVLDRQGGAMSLTRQGWSHF